MKMKGKMAHITTANGTPICKLGMFLEVHRVTCGHNSFADAKRTVEKLRKEGFKTLKPVKGPCPA